MDNIFKISGPPYELDDLDYLYDHMFTIGVPYNSPPELKKYVFAAAKSYYSGNKSIDYTLKRYGDAWEFDIETDEKLKRFRKISSLIKEHIKKNKSKLSGIPNKPNVVGLFAAEAAIVKLASSFRSSLILSRMGFFFESSCICRFILEQISWAYSIRQINDESIFKTSVTKSINSIKDIIPTAGKLYGFLSNLAHISPQYSKDYIEFNDGKQNIVLSSQDNMDIVLYILLILLDIYEITSEAIFVNMIEKPELVKYEKGKFTLNKDRELLDILSEFRKNYIENS